MSASVLYMSMSLDGFIAGPNETVENELGDGGMRLHDWGFKQTETGEYVTNLTGVNAEVMGEANATGAAVCGRGTIDPAGGWGGDQYDGPPVFVYTRRPLGPDDLTWSHVTYVNDIVSAIQQARQAAGEKDVSVQGAGTAQAALAAGVLDELQIHLVPVLLGEGRRLFEHLGTDHIEMEPIRVLEGAGATHLRYRVRR